MCVYFSNNFMSIHRSKTTKKSKIHSNIIYFIRRYMFYQFFFVCYGKNWTFKRNGNRRIQQTRLGVCYCVIEAVLFFFCYSSFSPLIFHQSNLGWMEKQEGHNILNNSTEQNMLHLWDVNRIWCIQLRSIWFSASHFPS